MRPGYDTKQIFVNVFFFFPYSFLVCNKIAEIWNHEVDFCWISNLMGISGG